MLRVHKNILSAVKIDVDSLALNDLPMGKSGRIRRIRGPRDWRRRCAELGIVPGATIRVVRAAPLGGPVLIEIGDCRFSIHGGATRRIELESDVWTTPAEGIFGPSVRLHGDANPEPAAPVSLPS